MRRLENYIEEINFDTCESLLKDFLFDDPYAIYSRYIFRGLGHSSYELLPSILRKECIIEWKKSFSKLHENIQDESELNQQIFELGLIKLF